MYFLNVVFVKKVISLIMIFLVGFTTQIQEKQTKDIDPVPLAKFEKSPKLVTEECALSENLH